MCFGHFCIALRVCRERAIGSCLDSKVAGSDAIVCGVPQCVCESQIGRGACKELEYIVVLAHLIGLGCPEVGIAFHKAHEVNAVVELAFEAEVALVEQCFVTGRSSAEVFKGKTAGVYLIK